MTQAVDNIALGAMGLALIAAPVLAQDAAPSASLSNAEVSSRVWQNGRWVSLPAARTSVADDHTRWPRDESGRWEAGARAPGGWAGYRPLRHGSYLPHFWNAGSFGIDDFLTFSLAAPPQGYRWVRYYDDAVLVDQHGLVWDSVPHYWGGADRNAAQPAPIAGAPYIQPIDPNQALDAGDAIVAGQEPAAVAAVPGANSTPVPPPPPPPLIASNGANGPATFYTGQRYGDYHYWGPAGGTVLYYVTPTVTTTTVVEEYVE